MPAGPDMAAWKINDIIANEKVMLFGILRDLMSTMAASITADVKIVMSIGCTAVFS
jgi:hypothetical protein